MGNTRQKNLEIQKKNQNELRKLEQFYVEGKVDTMLQEVEEKKQELVEDMKKYAEKHTRPSKFDKDGNPIAYKIDINPLIITNYFFKSIVPIQSQEPEYNAEKLGMVFDYYCDILAEVNDKIGYFPSSLVSFCKLAGITANTLRAYKNSNDYNMRIIAQKIYDQIGDENLTFSQMGITRERSTIFKLKSQNEMVEKEQPKVNINITEQPNMEKIRARLEKYNVFTDKKGNK